MHIPIRYVLRCGDDRLRIKLPYKPRDRDAEASAIRDQCLKAGFAPEGWCTVLRQENAGYAHDWGVIRIAPGDPEYRRARP